MRVSIARVSCRAPGLGIATAIAVAWAIALWNPSTTMTCTGAAHPQPCGVVRLAATGQEISAVLRGLDNDPLAVRPRLGTYTQFTFLGGVSWTGSTARHSGFLLNGGDRHAEVRFIDPAIPADADIVALRAVGWPMRCLVSTALRDDADHWSDRGAIPIAADRFGGAHLFSRSLPVRPLPLGFLIDTLAFASGWWALLAAPGLIRPPLIRWRRRRRSRCRGCGYDLRGAVGPVCPECGRSLPRRLVRAPGRPGSRTADNR